MPLAQPLPVAPAVPVTARAPEVGVLSATLAVAPPLPPPLAVVRALAVPALAPAPAPVPPAALLLMLAVAVAARVAGRVPEPVKEAEGLGEALPPLPAEAVVEGDREGSSEALTL